MKKVLILLLVFGPAVPAQKVTDSGVTIRTETREVLVDSVVTDKKGNYIHGLTQKDFKVWEDGKEQTLTSFRFQADGAPAGEQTHRMMLFFDNATARFSDQVYVRKAATQFVEANAGPGRQIAVIAYSGAAFQNFTEDKERLKAAIAKIPFSAPDMTTGKGSSPGVASPETGRLVLMALRHAANSMAAMQGRKTLVFLSAGFLLQDLNRQEDMMADLSATISACNKDNVAVYPVDVRGLVATLGWLPNWSLPGSHAGLSAMLSMPQAFQVRGGGTTGGGSTGGGAPAGGASGTRGGVGTSPSPAPSGNPGGGNPGVPTRGAAPTTGPPAGTNRGSAPTNQSGGFNNNNNNFNNTQNTAQRLQQRIIPQNDFGKIASTQEVLYSLAAGTGGFVIVNSNDMLAGLEKISKDQNEYYVVGYTPQKEPVAGTCHTLKVKVDQSGSSVRSRSGYCDAKPLDVLSGTPVERDLEAKLKAGATSTVTARMLAPFFYIGNNTARVNVALELPPDTLKFAKEKGQFLATMNVIGTAYFADGGVAAHFSDSAKVSFPDKKQMEEFQTKSYHYEKQFEMAPGKFTLKLAFASGSENFGHLEMPLTIEPLLPTQFGLSGLALSKVAMPAAALLSTLDAALVEDETPLIVNGVRIVPTGTNHFKKSEHVFVFAEIYEPGLAAPDTKVAPALGTSMMLLDDKGETLKKDFGVNRVSPAPPLGNATVPVGLRLPLADIAPGNYQLAITALNEANQKVSRITPIVVEP